ncbi:TA system VapC family ribonuclease toxin [Arthrobacter bambusae]
MSDLDLPDVNVVIALLHPGHVHHPYAQHWFANVRRFATTPITETGFIRLALNPTVMGGQTSSEAALASLRSLRADPRATFLPDNATLADPVISVAAMTGHRQVTDMHLVNLAVVNSARLVTFDQRIASTLTGAATEAILTL